MGSRISPERPQRSRDRRDRLSVWAETDRTLGEEGSRQGHALRDRQAGGKGAVDQVQAAA